MGAGLKLGSVQGNVELRDITFVYPARPEVTVFSHFDLKVPAGQTVALVGQSGSGKYALVLAKQHSTSILATTSVSCTVLRNRDAQLQSVRQTQCKQISGDWADDQAPVV